MLQYVYARLILQFCGRYGPTGTFGNSVPPWHNTPWGHRLNSSRSFDGRFNSSAVVGFYVGSPSGTFVQFPGDCMCSEKYKFAYDPSKRPWYQRAQTYKDKFVFSTPYADASTGQSVDLRSRVNTTAEPRLYLCSRIPNNTSYVFPNCDRSIIGMGETPVFVRSVPLYGGNPCIREECPLRLYSPF